jgi:hypothetical protein
MRSNDRLRATWRSVSGPAPTRDVDFDALATSITTNATRALRATRRARVAAIALGFAAVALVAMAVSVIPARPQATLLGAISGGEAPARTFEVAMVGPRDGAWLIAAAIGTDR